MLCPLMSKTTETGHTRASQCNNDCAWYTGAPSSEPQRGDCVIFKLIPRKKNTIDEIIRPTATSSCAGSL